VPGRCLPGRAMRIKLEDDEIILEDYIDRRKRPWVKPTNALAIYFISEPAVDDGGPKREFVTYIVILYVSNSEYILFGYV
jgi:hypothetical protein